MFYKTENINRIDERKDKRFDGLVPSGDTK